MPNGNRFYLNGLRAGDTNLSNPGSGVWENDSQARDFLVKFASAIDVSGQVDDPHAAHSVPSVFARPILFYQALKDRNNPLHNAIVRQWRGLLAVFGLQSWMGYNITVKRYDVPELDAKAESAPGTGGNGNLHLTTILRQQLPRPAAAWERWWMIYCNERLVGATSPWTMLYTPAEYNAPSAIPWRNEHGLLDDPISYFDPDRRGVSTELAILYRWVQFVALGETKRWGMDPMFEPQANVIATELASWSKALAKYAQERFAFEGLSHARVDSPPYSSFTAPLPAMENGGDESDLLLDSARLGERKVLALAKRLAPGDRVYGALLASQLDVAHAIRTPEGNNLRTLGGKEIQAEYVFPEELFLPKKLVGIPLSNSAMRCGAAKVALPITPKFFEYFNLDDLAKRKDMMSVEESDDIIHVRLRLKLKGGKTLTVEKSYSRATDVITLNAGAPGMAVWPDKYADDWRENFAAYNWPILGQGPDLTVAPLFADGGTGEESANNDSQKPLRIWQCDRFVIGFAVRYRDSANDTRYEAGVVVRGDMSPARKTEGSTRWEIGLDFGTSSTTVAVRRNGAGVELMSLKGGRSVFLSELSEALQDRREDIYRNLYPLGEIKTPFPTLLYDSYAHVMGPRRSNFVMRFDYSVTDRQDERAKPVPNLKWVAGGTDRAPLQHYLASLVRELVWEARSEGIALLEFKWSYPLSLPEASYSAMQTFWTNLGMSYRAVGNPAGSMAIEVGESISESEAVCRCLAAHNLVEIYGQGLTIAVDIGGGSTDVGIWRDAKLLDQVSFKLAGNDILIPQWLEFGFLDELFRICKNGTSMPSVVREIIQGREAIFFNHLLAAEAGGHPGHHPVPMAIHAGQTADLPWLYIRTLAYIFFSGISFYVGLHARKFLGDANAVKQIKICFGGRGASLISWITNQENKATAFLKEAVLDGLKYGEHEPDKFAVGVEVIGKPFSRSSLGIPLLKEEVARGLLAPPLGAVTKKKTTIVGENEWTDKDGKEVKWDSEVDLEALSKLQPPDGFEGSLFIAWLKAEVLPKHSALNLDLQRIKQLKIQTSKVQQMIGQMSAQSEQLLQPVFACELKALMDDYVNKVLSGSSATSA